MKKTVFYNLYQIDRIGQLADEVYAIRNLYPEDQYYINFVTMNPDHFGQVNRAFYDIATRGAQIMWSSDEAEVKRYHGEKGRIEENDDNIYVFIAPMFLRIMTIKHLTQTPPCFSFSLSVEEREKGLEIQRRFGIPDNAEIITLHVRDGSFEASPERHQYRNANIGNYFPALEYLMSLGYYIVRIGDPKMQHFIDPPAQLIDAPFHPDYESLVEPYFISKSKFFIGMTSGPASLANGFNVPILYTDSVISRYCWNRPHDLWVFKRVFDNQLGRELRFEEILTSEISQYYDTNEFTQRGLKMVNNTPEEILAAVKEMEQRIKGRHTPSSDAAICAEKVKATLKVAHEYALKQKSFNAYHLQTFNISEAYMDMNRDFFGITS